MPTRSSRYSATTAARPLASPSPRSEEHTSELQSHRDLHSFPTRRSSDLFFRLSDIAKVQRGYADPQQPIFRYNGRSAIGLAISMRKNGDVLAFGEHIKERLAKATADLPVGFDSHLVA